ncbi:DUF2254 domain-containing protein [Gimesia sp.]|uniref:DUF2254 domain-containing protein n=1 Tax=Gimesia sp. TaxID=2024833 RepID=UPI003A930197
MRARLENLWDSFRTSFWFVPTIMALMAILLAYGTNQLDNLLIHSERSLSWFTTTAPAARSTLSSVAGATIALAGVVFSITIVSLSIASSQYGSRLVRNVMGASIADLVIGQYVGTSLYCLLVLQNVREAHGDSPGFTPQVGTSVGLLLGLISMGMLIWFIHHVATAIQAPTIITEVSHDLEEAIDRLFPERMSEESENEVDAEQPDVLKQQTFQEILSNVGKNNVTVPSHKEGYIEGIDGGSLISLALELSGVVELMCKPGDYITKEQILARIWFQDATETEEAHQEQTESVCNTVHRVIIIGPRRTPRQDVSYAALELVEIAVRALSPGINDPFTAMTCVDRLGGAMGRFAERSRPVQIRRDSESIPRVLVTSADDFADVLTGSFGMIREYGFSSTAVSLKMLEALSGIASHASRPDHLKIILQEAEALKSAFENHHIVQTDRIKFQQAFLRLTEKLEPGLQTT